jgi:hypothetical protein
VATPFDNYLNTNNACLYDWFCDGIQGRCDILASLPQTVYSLLYLSYNPILTRIFISHEWSTYPTDYSGLRTSWVVGQQRSTYFLQLPYHYTIPFMTLSLLLH